MHLDPQALAAGIRQLRPGCQVEVHRLTSDGRSWVLHAPRWWPIGAAAFEEVWRTRPAVRPTGKIFGRTVQFPRFQQAYGFDYEFTGQVAAARPLDDVPMPAQQVLETLRRVQSASEPQNSALFNFYDGGLDYMGAHSDDERQLHRGAPVLSLSWCQPARHARRFRLTPKATTRDAVVPAAWRVERLKGAVLSCGDGDLLVMGGACQQTHKHEVMKAPSRSLSESEGRRINMTIRSFADAAAAVPSSAAGSGAVARLAAVPAAEGDPVRGATPSPVESGRVCEAERSPRAAGGASNKRHKASTAQQATLNSMWG